MIMGRKGQPVRTPVLISLAKAKQMIQVKDRRTVIRLIKRGQVKGGKIGGQWKVNRDSLREYVRNAGVF